MEQKVVQTGYVNEKTVESLCRTSPRRSEFVGVELRIQTIKDCGVRFCLCTSVKDFVVGHN